MHSRFIKLSIAPLAALMLTTAAYAAPNCTAELKAKWMPAAAMQKRIAMLGFKVKAFKVSGNCYEIYGWTKDGKKAEVYFNPVTGAVVKSKIED